MSGPRLGTKLNRSDRQRRLDQYRELRDGGSTSFEAARQVGIASRTGAAYERWYRAVTGQPPREQWDGRHLKSYWS